MRMMMLTSTNNASANMVMKMVMTKMRASSTRGVLPLLMDAAVTTACAALFFSVVCFLTRTTVLACSVGLAVRLCMYRVDKLSSQPCTVCQKPFPPCLQSSILQLYVKVNEPGCMLASCGLKALGLGWGDQHGRVMMCS